MAVTNDVATRDYWQGRGLMWLWASVLLAPLAWGLDQSISYASMKPICFADASFTLPAISMAALVMVGAGAFISRACLVRLTGATDDGGGAIDRSYFMAIIALALNSLVGLLIVFAAVPQFMLSPCE